MAAPWLEQLNPAQRQAATCGDGPVLVIAGAGTGKTRTLACRVAHLVERGIDPQRICLLTFTRRAAREMLTRAASLTHAHVAGRVWGGTFHATANRLLRQYGPAIGLDPQFTVVDQADAADLINLIRSDLGYAESKKRFPRKQTLIAIYSRMVSSRSKLADVVLKHYPWCEHALGGMREIFEHYTRRKREQNTLDYDDLLLFWNALCGAAGVGEEVCDRFDHILVDEYQDTNLIQAELLQAMRRRRSNIMVVGDDAQSIYSFRAATVRNILDFPQQFPGTQVIKLEQNYRSVQPILDASNAVMRRAAQRYTKDLFTQRGGGARPVILTCLDEAQQCQAVCDAVLARHEEGKLLRQQAVLFRAGHHSDALEVELTRRNIPFVKYGGLKFVEAAHVKDMVAILRLLVNPADEISWFRVLLMLEGVGPVTARRMTDALLGRSGGDEARRSPLRRLVDHPPPAPPAAAEGLNALRACVRDCLGDADTGARLPPAATVERVRRYYEPLFERLYDNPAVRVRDLEQLELIADGYRTVSAFITDLTLDPPASTQDLAGPPLLEEDFLILSTIHSAKGCEWDAVYIIHCADGMMPSDMATGSAEEIEEERRLLYVAMTRARDVLQLLFPLRYYFRKRPRGDGHSYAQLSRFIDAEAKACFDLVAVHDAAEDGRTPRAAGPPASTTVDAMLSDLLQ